MKKFVISILVVMLTLAVTAQNRIISGVVKASDDGLPIPGVTVVIKGTTIGTTTNTDGKYLLPEVKAGQVLHFSFIGYQAVEITLKNEETLDVILVPSVTNLDEVVVTALGVKREKKEIGYSTEKVDAADIVRSGAPNVINAISGRSSGVQVSQGDGVDGSTRITIRGNNNLNKNNQPLIVIDNIPMDNQPGFEITNNSGGRDWGNAISDINAYDIEDYTILKGGAAAALYGERGANGVILITTKKGKKQAGIGVTYNFDYKITQPFLFRDVQNKYGFGGPLSLTEPEYFTDTNGITYYPSYVNGDILINENGKTVNSNTEFGYYGSSASWGPEMNGQMIQWWDGELHSYSPQPDNLRMAFQDGITATHNVSIQSGNDKGTFRLSFTRQDVTPIINNSNSSRNTINLGSTVKISDKLKADITMSYVNYQRMNAPALGNVDDYSVVKGFLYSWPRSYQEWEMTNYELADGTRNPHLDPYLYVSDHIWWNYYNQNSWLDRNKYSGNIVLTYDVNSWLHITGKAGRDYTVEQYTSKNKPVDIFGKLEGKYASGLGRMSSDNFDLMATVNKEDIFGSKWKTDFTLGTSRWNFDSYRLDGQSGTWFFPNTYTFANYTDYVISVDDAGNMIVKQQGDNLGNVVATEYIRKQRINSVFAYLNLSYSTYLHMQLTGRNDWSSTLDADNNSFFYPGASISYFPTEMFKGLEKYKWLNSMQIHAAWAKTANSAEPYQKNFYYNVQIEGGQPVASYPTVIPPIKLRPQFVDSYEAGMALDLFESVIELDFTYYYKHSTDQILNLPLPVSSGAAYVTINEGELMNKGVDITLKAVPYHSKDWLIETAINYNRNRNYILDLGDYSDVYELASIWGLHGPAMELREGDEYGTIVGYDYLYDESGNKILNDEGTKYLTTDTRVPIGNASPDFLAGFTTNIKYKNLRFSGLIDTKWGGEIYCGSYVINMQSGQSPATLFERDGNGLPYTDPDGITRNVGVILPGVHEDGTPNTTVVHYYYKYMPNMGGWGDILTTPGVLENTWVKMRELSLTYTFSQKQLSKQKFFQGLSLSIVGRDLFYFYKTLPDNINPEGILGSGNAQGFEFASFPGTRSFAFSFKVDL
jgi:iron complex outermembrane recepter protein